MYTVLIGIACVILTNAFNVSSLCLFIRDNWRLFSSLSVLVVWFVLFCGREVICLLIHLEIYIDSVNDMAVISMSHLNNDIS